MTRRPNLTLAVRRLIRDVARRVPELGHVRASAVLVVAGEARGLSRASVGPAVARARAGTRLLVNGRRILYVMTLRPLWFVASTPEERVATVLHELHHLSHRFDGTLDAARKHARLPRRVFDAQVDAMLGRYLARAPHEVLAPFAHEGLVKVRMWLRRPDRRRPPRDAAGDLFVGTMPLGALHRRARRARKVRT